MTPDEIKALIALPDALDALTAKISDANAKLRAQVVATREILAGLGMAPTGPIPAAEAAPPAFVPYPVVRRQATTDPAREAEARKAAEEQLEQRQFLASKKAERAHLVATARGET